MRGEHGLQWLEALLPHLRVAEGLRGLPVGGELQRHHADLRWDQPHLPSLRSGCRLPGQRARLPGVGGLRGLLGHQHRPVRRRDANLRHQHSQLRAVSLQHAVLGGDAGLPKRHQELRGMSGERRLRGEHARVRSGLLHLPSLYRRQRVQRHHPGLSELGRLRPVLGRQLPPVHRDHPGLLHADRDLRPLHGERRLLGHDTGLQRQHAHLSGLQRRQRLRRRHARLSGLGRLRSMFWNQCHGLHGRDAGLLHDDGNLRALRIECAVRGDDAGVQHGHPQLPGLQRRWRVWRRDAGLSGVGRLRPVLGDERHQVLGGDAGLLHDDGDLRAVHVERAVRGDDAGVQHDHARLPRLRRRHRVRRRHAGLSGVGRLRSVLGHQHHGLHRRDTGLLHDHGDLRAVHLERAVRGNVAGVQHDHAQLPGLQRGQRVRRDHAGLSSVGRLRSVFGHERHRLHGGDARLLHDDRDLRAVYLERAVRGNDAGVQHDDARLPGLQRRRRVRRRHAGLSSVRRLRAMLG